MDSEPRAFEAAFVLDAGTPLRCPRPMLAQPLVPWTPARLIAAGLMAMLWVPAQLVPAVINRRRA